MQEMNHDEVKIYDSQNVPPPNGYIQLPLGGIEQANFIRTIVILSEKTIKIQYRTSGFIFFPIGTKEQVREFVCWLKYNVTDVTPEQFGNHYSDLAYALGCE